jgi:hypothetical protein
MRFNRIEMINIGLLDMPRKTKTFKLDERVLAALEDLARLQNASANRYLENLLFAIGKEKGVIPIDEMPLGETRGVKAKLSSPDSSATDPESNTEK